ncbi:MAG TPA: sodium:solute symporter family protein, partial [Saprospiraceae bacterium]|nr:sodium:solute symporter family protein [Saprospiraceae bacterium]
MLVGFIIFYLLGTLAIGYWASRRVKSTQDFVIAGRKLPLGVAASALFATSFGSETIMGASSEFVSGGVLGVIEDPFGAALCLILVGAFVARPLYKLNILTFNDYFRMRYDRRTEVISAVFTVPSYFGWIAAQLIALAIILQLLLGVPLWAGILICMLVVLFYTYIGGMWAVSVTDFVQTIIIVLGLSVLFFSITDQAGGLGNVIQNTPEDFFNILPASDLHSMVHYFAAWITIGLGSIPQQDIFQRVMAAKSEKVSVQSAYLAGIMYLTIGFLPLMIGLAGSQIYPEVLAEKDPQMALPPLELPHAGFAFQILFFGALLSA